MNAPLLMENKNEAGILYAVTEDKQVADKNVNLLNTLDLSEINRP